MVIYGLNPVLEALRSNPARLARVRVLKGRRGGRIQQIIDLARQASVPVRFETPATLDRLSTGQKHQGVVAEMAEVAYCELEQLLRQQPDLLLIADGVEDPRNLGALIRTAEAAGAAGLLLPSRRSSSVTPAVVKASAGAALLLPIVQIGNLAQTLEKLKAEGFWILGLDPQGESQPWEVDASLRLAVVVGSEHRGLRPLAARHCDLRVSLPMSGRVGSLNLSVAAGVLLYQIAIARLRAKE